MRAIIRNTKPLQSPQRLLALTFAAAIAMGAPGFERLTIGGGATYTFRAVARLKRPDGSVSADARSLAAVIRFPMRPTTERYTILRWYDNAWAQ